MLRRVRGPIPESQIDQAITRDSELRWPNILEKPMVYPPMDHDHLYENENGTSAEPWLDTLIMQAMNTRSPIIHSHIPQRGPISYRYPNGLAANTWIRFFSADSLTPYKAWVLKVVFRAVGQPPYLAAGTVLFCPVVANQTNFSMPIPLCMHTGNQLSATMRASGGIQQTPMIEIQFPFNLPSNSTVTAEFFELF